MALANCDECGKELSEHAEVCPHCAAPAKIALRTLKAEQERLEQGRLECERLERERLERERLEANRLYKEQLEQERLEQERLEQERLEQERLEQERLEQERLEQERLEQERLEQERLEQERLEQERLEQERLEQERLEQERLEQERPERERLEQERLEQERPEREQAANDFLSFIPKGLAKFNSDYTKLDLTVPSNNLYWSMGHKISGLNKISALSLTFGSVDIPQRISPLKAGAEITQFIGKLTNLKHLDLECNGVNCEPIELEPLLGLKKLKELYLGCSSEDLRPLGGLTELEYFQHPFLIGDSSFLGKLTKLNRLMLECADIIDLSPLANLKELEELDISNFDQNEELGDAYKLRDYSHLQDLPNLRTLRLPLVSLGDISFLAPMTQLEHLDLSYNGHINISEFPVIYNLYNLRSLHLPNPFSYDIKNNHSEYWKELRRRCPKLESIKCNHHVVL